MPESPKRRGARRARAVRATPGKTRRRAPTRPRDTRRGKTRAREARSDMYRALVIEAAEALFAHRGIDDTRMEAIAAEAGLSLGTLYSVFAGKAEIVRAIHETRLQDVLRRAIDSARGLTEPLDMLLAGVRTYVGFFLRHPNYLRMHLRDGYSWAGAAAAAASRKQADAWRQGVAMQAALFARGAAAGTFYPGDPMVQTKMMIAMQQVQLASWIDNGVTGDSELLITEIEEQVRRSFCPAPGPRRIA